jgi:NAD(P)-dependent dehydrogenase (short-subunit alcohol dehydrogenase family)
MSSSFDNQTAILTGATGAIGEAIAKGLAERGLSLVLIVRNPEKSADLIDRLKSTTGNQRIKSQIADLSRMEQINKMTSAWSGPLNILVNNAAIAPVSREETPEGIELQFATNVLSYFWMIEGFAKHMAAVPNSRIVNVASYWAGDLALDDLEFTKRSYHNHTAYRQSKQANRMLTPIFAKLLKSQGTTVNSCHPGDVNSRLSNDLGFGGSQVPAQGAETPLWLATSTEVDGMTGKYFEHKKEVHCPFSANQADSQHLFELCSSYAKQA